MEEIITEKTEKVCSKCGRTLPIAQFNLIRYKHGKHRHRAECKECEYERHKRYHEKKKQITFSDDLEILVQRQYKKIDPKRILDISDLDIIPLGPDEIFIRMMDYKDAWLSNYGRVVRYSNNRYTLLKGGYDAYMGLRYTLRKNVFVDGKWTYKRVNVYAKRAVVDGFIINPDEVNNIYIWHKGYDKNDYYYKNLYPLGQEQYRIVKQHFKLTGDDSEEFILKVMNDIRFKPEDWSRRKMRPTVCGIGYQGTEGVDCKSEAYIRWHDMLCRCYNEKFHERNPQYKGCTVYEGWLNFNNFKHWYEENRYGDMQLDMDKDILSKGNKIYGPETVVLVPHFINTLFVNGKKRRGALPIGVHYDTHHDGYRAEINSVGKQKKLGIFRTAEEAFYRYKGYKEKLIKDIAEQNKDKIPDKAYRAMLEWKIEIDD